MGLRTKFNLVLIVVLSLGLVASGVLSYRILQENARKEVIQHASIMMEGALAVRGYTNSQIKPLLQAQLEQEFLPQSVPAYSANQIFDSLREKKPDYTYKEATLNPTNPRDRAVDWEVDIICQFINFPERKEMVGERETLVGDSFFLARPIHITNPACLTCHGTVEDAPQTMIDLYGDSNGFGWNLDEIVGAQIVSVPQTVPQEKAMKAFYTFMGSLIAIFFVILVSLNILLNTIIIKPVRRLSSMADALSTGDRDVPEFPSPSRDEIGVLATSFNRLHRSLKTAMQLLDD